MPPQMSSTTPEKFLLTWVLQMNYPLIKVELARNSTLNTTIFKFDQERFYLAIKDEEYLPEYISPYKYIHSSHQQILNLIISIFLVIRGKFY